ncbi:MAG: hypothetical protein ABJN69_01025 [Hellea sp.]
MFIRLHMITSDAANAERFDGIRRIQAWTKWNPTKDDLPLEDGPENPRVKIIDMDPETGEIIPGAKLVTPTRNKYSYFDFGKKGNYNWAGVRQVSLFTTVMRVLDLFENKDALGRRLKWAFGDQLTVYARAGKKANASYQRKTGSLQFFYFTPENKPDTTIHLADSPDIVAHEAGHAVLDAIAPDLYTSRNPQTRAIHEAVADLTATLFAFEMDDLGSRILESTDGRLDTANEFGWIGETFGTELREQTGDTYLRTLYNENSIDPGSPNYINSKEAHHISTVMSGAVFAGFIDEFERRKRIRAERGKITTFSASGKTLWEVGGFVRRALFRGLDYLPPGDVNFIDLARAMVATDTISFPKAKDSNFRQFLISNCIDRGIGSKPEHLEYQPIIGEDPATRANLVKLATDLEYAANFAEENRDFLRLPTTAKFTVTSLFKTQKKDVHSGGIKKEREEIVLKVRWSENETGRSLWGINRFPVRRGTTLVIDLNTKRTIIRLTNNPDYASDDGHAEMLASAVRKEALFHSEASSHAAIM